MCETWGSLSGCCQPYFSYGAWRHVTFYKGINISEERTASFFRVEAECNEKSTFVS
jgi:hypothetical protein